MQDELAAETLAREVKILGVNMIGAESGVTEMCTGRDLPLLQDTQSANVWSKWQVAYRDVIVLDAENRVIAVYNLTSHNLGEPAKYQALKTVLRNAAAAE